METAADASVQYRERRVREGDRRALADLLEEHAEALERWIDARLDHRLRGRVSASDVMQDVYLDADQRLEHFETLTEMPFGIWIRLLARQRLIDLHRRHVIARARTADLEMPMDAGSGSGTMAAMLAGSTTSPSRIAVRHEEETLVRQALDRLEAPDREVLTLRHFEGLGNHEIAARLGLTGSAATKRYIRALARLKLILDAMGSLHDSTGERGVDHACPR